MNIYSQSGYNDKFPGSIKVWRVGDKIPEWLSDRAKIEFVDGDGNLTLSTLETSTGGIEIMDSSGKNVLIKLNNKSDYLCISEDESGNIFSLSEKQINLLYKKK